MPILITGATGLIGRALTRRLLSVGADVRVLSRRPHRVAEYFGDAVESHEWHPLSETPPAAAFAGVDVVINLMGEPLAGRWSREKKRRIRSSRVDATAKIVAAIGERPVRLVNASTYAIYPGRAGETYQEGTALGPPRTFMERVAREWEEAALGAEKASVALMRFGRVSGPEGFPSPHTRLALLATAFLAGRLDHIVPMIDIDDAVLMLIWAAGQVQIRGPINCVAPARIDYATLIARLEAFGGMERLPHLPERLARLYARAARRGALGSYDVRPEVALRAGYEFMRPDAEAILERALPGSGAQLQKQEADRAARAALRAERARERERARARRAAAREARREERARATRIWRRGEGAPDSPRNGSALEQTRRPTVRD